MSISAKTHRLLAARGLQALRFKGRDPNDYRNGGYMIVEERTRVAVAGNYPDFHMTGQDVREFARSRQS